jgi:hypothetical protein
VDVTDVIGGRKKRERKADRNERRKIEKDKNQ